MFLKGRSPFNLPSISELYGKEWHLVVELCRGNNMYGLDSTLVETIDYGLAIGRVKTDVLDDFLLAPQYSAVYTWAADKLIEQTKTLLTSGQYAPELPIKVDVPKRTGLTRPGAILLPIDRLVYQVLVNTISKQAEEQLDRSRVFSHVLLTDDPEFKMFKPNNDCWQNMQNALNEKSQDNSLPYVIKTDVACYFERIYQHNLINLLRSSAYDSRAINLLERILLAFTENDSHGILQGMFPSDLLGNFYLATIDAGLKVKDVEFIRYVDDMYLFHTSMLEAQKGLVNLCRMLRDEGLSLNESKTGIYPTNRLVAEETEIDRLFGAARQEIRETELEVSIDTPYGFQTMWVPARLVLPQEEIELIAVEELYRKTSDTTVDDEKAEKIEKFCLPYLSRVGNKIAIERSLDGIVSRPHLSKIYCNYLLPLAQSDSEVSKQLEFIIANDQLPYDWSLIWPIAALIDVNSVSNETVTKAMQIIQDSRRLDGLRGIAAYLVAKHGSATQRRLLRHQYDQEPSPYAKGAILFSTRYFPTNERNSCLGAWGSHSITNSLIASAIRSGNP